MAYAPPPPPSPQHLAQVAEALCARAEARRRATAAAAHKQNMLWQSELSRLRNTSPPAKVATRATGAAAVLEARLARIVPLVKPQAKPQASAEPSQSRIDAYNARMARYFTPVAAPVPPQVRVSPTVAPAPTPVAKPKPPSSPRRIARPRVVEPALAAAPVRAAIAPMPVKPLLRPTMASVQQQTVAAPKTVTEPVEEEQVQRPNLIEAIVRAFNRFMGGLKDKGEEKKSKEAEAVAIGAAAQVLAVFLTLGKN